MTRLSAIIPTRDRPEMLRDCLATLQRQDVAPGELEVVVVDDGSTANIGEIVNQVNASRVTLRHVRQAAAGLNAARNRGIEVATGELLAFLDDDVLVSPKWAASLLDAFRNPDCAAVGGRVELLLEESAPRWLTEGRRSYLAEFELGVESKWLDDGTVPVGANCAVRRDVFDRLGGFRAGLDRIGSSLVSNGDTEFFRRVRRQGGKIRYEPRAHVRHRVPGARLTPDYFHRRAYAQGVSDQLLAMPHSRARTWQARGREVVRMGRALPILTKGMIQRREAINAALWLSYCQGRAATLGSKQARARSLGTGTSDGR